MNAVPTISAHTAREPQNPEMLAPGKLSIWRGLIKARNTGRATLPPIIRDRVVAEVSAETGVSVREIMSRDRTQRVFKARAEAIQRLRDMETDDGEPRFSMPAIGRAFGRDHCAISNALSKRSRGRVSA